MDSRPHVCCQVNFVHHQPLFVPIQYMKRDIALVRKSYNTMLSLEMGVQTLPRTHFKIMKNRICSTCDIYPSIVGYGIWGGFFFFLGDGGSQRLNTPIRWYQSTKVTNRLITQGTHPSTFSKFKSRIGLSIFGARAVRLVTASETQIPTLLRTPPPMTSSPPAFARLPTKGSQQRHHHVRIEDPSRHS